MRIAAVVLDMDGLMLDTEPIYKRAWQQAATEFGYTLDDKSYLNLVGQPTEDCESQLGRQFGTYFPMAAFRARWPELWEAEAARCGISTKAGLTEFLSLLDSARVPVAIATSSDSTYTESSLRRAGLSGRFGVIVTRDQVGRGKPAPDLYLEAARRLDVEPSRCLVLEDSDAGIIAANAAGMVALMIPDLKPPSAEALRVATQVLASLHEARDVVAALLSDTA